MTHTITLASALAEHVSAVEQLMRDVGRVP